MKRFLAFFLSLILFSVVFACTAVANESNPVYAHAEYSRDGDIISVKLSLRDIRDEVGIVCVDFTFIPKNGSPLRKAKMPKVSRIFCWIITAILPADIIGALS